MDIHIHNYPEPPSQRPQISPNLIRRIFEERKPLFDFLVKAGWSEDEASKMIIADSLKNS